jgi:alpha-L-arabinofuranosidase
MPLRSSDLARAGAFYKEKRTMKMRSARALLPALLIAVVASTGTSAASAAEASGNDTAPAQTTATAPAATTSIEVQADQRRGTVSPAVMGSTYLNAFGGMGSFDEKTDSFYPSFLNALKNEVYTGSLRFPGGINAQYFDWRRAVGPQSQRTDNPYGPAQAGSESAVGPDEFGRLLQESGATGIVTTNFATGDAKEAAELVEYMNGKKGSSYWADLRARNGHPSPYNIPEWEVGNEEYTTASSWRAGTLVSLGPGGSSCTADTATCEYVYGGSTSFTNQPVVGYADRTAAASASTGKPGQSFYAAYAPVSSGSQTVSVGGQTWTEVSSLAAAAPTDDVYTVDDATGKITFGDGTHGAIPAGGAQVTVSYVSGQHSGFLAFYQQMKKADPNIKVCSTDTSNAFIAAMGSALPYDCLQVHPYLSGSNTSADISTFERTSMAEPDSQEAALQSWESTIQAAAGHSVPLVLTEYGSLIGSTPDPTDYPYYDDSLDEALFNASQLANWIKEGITVADRQLLTAEQPDAANVTSGLPGAAPKAVTGAIVTPGPQVVVQPTGQYFRLFKPLAGGTQLDTTVLNNPVLTTSTSGSTAGDLSVVAADRQKTTSVVVINRDPDNAVSSTLNVNGIASGASATVTTLNGPSALSYNTAGAPTTVATSTSHTSVSNGAVSLAFPAHSITLVQVGNGGPAVTAPSAGATAQAPTLDPGGTDEVTATITNSGRTTVSGSASLVLPGSDWSGTPASGSETAYTLAPGTSTTVSYEVTAPGTVTPGSYDIGVAVTDHSLTTSVGSVSVQVPAPASPPTGSGPPADPVALPNTFDNVGITDDSDVTPGEYDGVGNSFSAQALAAGGLTPGGTFTADGLSFTWPDVAAGTDDNTLTEGQTISVSGSGTELGFVGTSTSGLLSGTGTVYYTDGTTSAYTLSLGRYFYDSDAATAGDNVVLTMPYINDSDPSTNGGSPQRQQSGTMFEQTVPITAGKTVEAVQLPNDTTIASGGRITGMHVFSIAIG